MLKLVGDNCSKLAADVQPKPGAQIRVFYHHIRYCEQGTHWGKRKLKREK